MSWVFSYKVKGEGMWGYVETSINIQLILIHYPAGSKKEKKVIQLKGSIFCTCQIVHVLPMLGTPVLLVKLRTCLAFWAGRAQWWVTLSCSFTNTPKSFSTELLLIHSPSSLGWCLGLPWPNCRTLHLALLSSWGSQRPSSQVCPSTRSLPSGILNTPQSLVSSANLLRLCRTMSNALCKSR